jgi:hypothetical protein
LERVVSMYLDYAENQASRQIPMKMADWVQKLDGFLQFNDYEILQNAGAISHDVAKQLAEQEYEKYRIIQDQLYESDFDKAVKRILPKTKLETGKLPISLGCNRNTFALKTLKGIFMKKSILFSLNLAFICCAIFTSRAQQVPDTIYTFINLRPAWHSGEGPGVFIDAAHNNFHTKDGGFFAFSKLLEQDGYQVNGLNQTISSPDILKACKILVISNALNDANVDSWILPTPSAFTKDEISIIVSWVENGGSLLLIADHMPFAGAAYELGNAFGFEFLNGFAYTGQGTWPPSVFTLKDGTLQDSPVTNNISNVEKIDYVATFTGSAFKVPASAIPVLGFLETHFSLQPDTAWSFNDNTPRIGLEGYYQGALLEFGRGKVAVFGEAAMFTAQLVNGNFKVGFNSEQAPQNAQFTLNLIHWLDN